MLPVFFYPVSGRYVTTPAADCRCGNHSDEPTGKKQIGCLWICVKQASFPVKNEDAEKIQAEPEKKRNYDGASDGANGSS